MAEVNLGVIAPVPKGEWNGETNYQPLNIVRLREALYMAIEPSQGIEPLVTTEWQNYWMLLFNQSSSIIPSLDSIAIGQIVFLDTAQNPYELYGGGQWLQIKDTFFLSAGDIYNVGETGGNSTQVLTTNQLPSHAHGITITGMNAVNGSASGESVGNGTYIETKDENQYNNLNMTTSTGNGEPFDIMPPYQVVYAWKRIA